MILKVKKKLNSCNRLKKEENFRSSFFNREEGINAKQHLQNRCEMEVVIIFRIFVKLNGIQGKHRIQNLEKLFLLKFSKMKIANAENTFLK